MKKFEFNDYTEQIDIAGHVFNLECTVETGEMIQQFRQKLVDISSEVTSGAKTAKDAIDLCFSMIDKVLGDGAADQIFDGRKKRLDDAVDVCLYIISVVTENYAKRNGS